MKTQESPEDYLEAIYLIIKTTGDVRSIDIANHFGYSKASVSVAMKKLRERGYITMDHSGRITLTNSGLETAAKVYERHEVLTRFLVALHVDEKSPGELKKNGCRSYFHLQPFFIFKLAYTNSSVIFADKRCAPR